MYVLPSVTFICALTVRLKPIDFIVFHCFCCHCSKLHVHHSIETSAMLWLNIRIWYPCIMLQSRHTDQWQIHSVVCLWSDLAAGVSIYAYCESTVSKAYAFITQVVTLILKSVYEFQNIPLVIKNRFFVIRNILWCFSCLRTHISSLRPLE
jgi:hypothetical protein